MHKISVIVPVYNAEKYLRQCLESILSQTLQDIEIICINDGSTDASSTILQEYAKQDSRLLVMDQENRGVAATRNRAISLSTSEFISFMDADDYYPEDDILEILYTKAIENNVVICGGEAACFTNENASLLQPFWGSLAGHLVPATALMLYKDYQFDYGFIRFIYKRDFLITHQIFFPCYDRFEDPPFFVHAMIAAGQFFAVKKITYAYRTSHKKFLLTPKECGDVLQGIRDNMRYACEYNLYYLGAYTFERLREHKIYPKKLSAPQKKLFFEIMSYYTKCIENNKLLHSRYRYRRFLRLCGELLFPKNSLRRARIKKYLCKYHVIATLLRILNSPIADEKAASR